VSLKVTFDIASDKTRRAVPLHLQSFLLGSHIYSVRAFCFSRRVCRLFVCLSVCLSRVRSRKLRDIRAKFYYPYEKSGLESKNMTSDFAPEMAK